MLDHATINKAQALFAGTQYMQSIHVDGDDASFAVTQPDGTIVYRRTVDRQQGSVVTTYAKASSLMLVFDAVFTVEHIIETATTLERDWNEDGRPDYGVSAALGVCLFKADLEELSFRNDVDELYLIAR